MSKNKDLLTDFIKYCVDHPQERFWQALRNWSGFAFVGVSNSLINGKPVYHDTFYFEEKQK